MMKKLFYLKSLEQRFNRQNFYKCFVICCFSLLSFWQSYAQVSDYVLSQEIGVYEELGPDATPLPAIIKDSGKSDPIMLGFDFIYDGVSYDKFLAFADGYISFNTNGATITLNNISAASPTTRPIIAPLWDDLEGNTNYGSFAGYEVTGEYPNRVMTVEWRNWEWLFNSNSAVISFQLKLYETTNVIEFIYRGESGNISNNASASIGINSASGTGEGTFLCVSDLNTFETSSTIANNSINQKPVDGQIIRFSPPTCPAPVFTAISNNSITSNSVELNWVSNGSSFKIQYAEEIIDPLEMAGTITNEINGTSATIDNLASGRTYYFYIQQYCDQDDESKWFGPFVVSTPLVPAEIPFQENFENYQEGWFLVNGTQTNKWYVGNTADMSVTNSLYVSGDQGASTNYNNVLSISHASKDFYIPEGTAYIDVSFDWLTLGGSTNDYLTAWIVPEDTTPKEGNLILAGTNRMQLVPRLNESSDLSTFSKTVDMTNYQGKVARLVLTWRNGTNASNPPAAIVNNITVIPTACTPVKNLVASEISSDSAIISWETASENFDIIYGFSNSPEEDWSLLENVQNNFLLEFLQASTNYSFKVRQNCGEQTSVWSAVGNFKTTQVVYTLPYSENFDDNEQGWEFSNGTVTNKWVIGSAAHEGQENALYISNDSGLTNAYTLNSTSRVFAYKDIELPAGTENLDISFDWRNVGESGSDFLAVWLVPQSFTPSASTAIVAASNKILLTGTPNLFHSNPNFVTKNYHVNVTGLDTEVFRIVFEWTNNSYGGNQTPAAIDNILISVANCNPINNIEVTYVNENSATIAWEESNGDVEIIWGPVGFTPTTDVLGSSSSIIAPFTIENLEQNTEYELMLRNVCEDNQTSIWSNPVKLITSQVAATLPFFEDFEGTSTSLFYKNGNQTNKWFTGSVPFDNGNNAMYISNDEGITNMYSHTSSVVHAYRDIEIPDGTQYVDFSFDWKAGGEGFLDYIRVWLAPVTYNPTTGSMILPTSNPSLIAVNNHTSQNFNLSTAMTSFNNVLDVASFAGNKLRLIFEWKNDGSGGVQNPAGVVDNILISVTSCHPVINLLATPSSNNSTVLSWESQGDLFDIVWGLAGFDKEGSDANLITNYSGQSLELLDLETETAYEFYVKNICDNSESIWSTKKQFNVGYCIPNGLSSYFIKEFTTTNGVENISNTSVKGTNGYSNHSNLYCSQYAGESINFKITPNSSTHYYFVWVDWNKDYDFEDEGEKLVATTSYTSSYSGSITIPEGQAAGSYRLRIANSYAGAINSACGPGPNSEFEDYTIEVLETLSIGENQFESLKVYPNPLKDMLNLSNATEISDVIIYNLLGQEVYKKKLNVSNAQLDLSNLPTGNYLVKINIEGILKTFKIIKE